MTAESMEHPAALHCILSFLPQKPFSLQGAILTFHGGWRLTSIPFPAQCPHGRILDTPNQQHFTTSITSFLWYLLPMGGTPILTEFLSR